MLVSTGIHVADRAPDCVELSMGGRRLPGAHLLIRRFLPRRLLALRLPLQDFFEQLVGGGLAAGRELAMAEDMFEETGIAANLTDLLPHHADDAMIHQEPATGTIVIHHVAQPDAALVV